MIVSQLRTSGVNAPEVLSAIDSVAREDFVDPSCRPVAYADRTTSAGKGRALLPPDVLGKLLETVGLSGGWKALGIGGTNGYLAAVLAALVRELTMTVSGGGLAGKRVV